MHAHVISLWDDLDENLFQDVFLVSNSKPKNYYQNEEWIPPWINGTRYVDQQKRGFRDLRLFTITL